MAPIVKRITQSVFTVWAVVTLSFAMVRFMPGGPAAYLRSKLVQSGVEVSPAEMQQQIELYLNVDTEKTLLAQYVDYMSALMHGDLGKSIWYGEPVIDLLVQALPWTIFVTSVALFLSFAIGIALGGSMAYNESSRFDSVATLTAMFINSVPFYLTAIVLVYFLGYQLGWFPTGGTSSSAVEAGLTIDYFFDVLYHAALPIASLVISGFGGWAIGMRSNSIQVLGEDYLRVARLRGLPERRIAWRYVTRNAILPMYTGLLISIGFLFGGAVILERIFSYPGLGYYLFKAVSTRDYPLLMGGFLMITIAVVVAVFIADLTYGLIDPRVNSGESDEAF